jgi:UDP-N-acetylglucosamine 2-epimerase (non-hydrolysing)
MTAAALVAMERVLAREKPEALLVYGDTNTTLAGALAAAKLHIPIVHVEAGIRQAPKTMPEEINRVVTDRLSRVLCCCSGLAAANLAREGITAGVHITGDVMYDQFLRLQASLTPTESCRRFRVDPESYIVVTLHRDFNVDSPESLEALLRALGESAQNNRLAVLFPIHPRTRKRVEEFALTHLLRPLTILPPLGYKDLMSLTAAAAFVVTDSGGLQKEAYYAGKRALVVMPDTGWRELTETGWNILVRPDAEAFAQAIRRILQPVLHTPHLYGRGDAARQIVEAIRKELFP